MLNDQTKNTYNILKNKDESLYNNKYDMIKEKSEGAASQAAAKVP